MALLGYTLTLGWVDDLGLAEMEVRATTDRDRVTGYTVWLALVRASGQRVAVRIYDYTHDFNEEHRCNLRGIRGTGRRFHDGTAGEGFHDAQRLIRTTYVTIIEAWAQQDT